MPTIPTLMPATTLANPCMDVTAQPFVHPFLRPATITRIMRDEEELNSWIKVRFLNSKWIQNHSKKNGLLRQLPARDQVTPEVTVRPGGDPRLQPTANYLPKHFGTVVLHNSTDRQLHRFCSFPVTKKGLTLSCLPHGRYPCVQSGPKRHSQRRTLPN